MPCPRAVAVLCATVLLGGVGAGCGPQPVASDVHEREPIAPLDDGSTPGAGSDTGVQFVDVLAVDDQEDVFTSISEDDPVQSWDIDIAADRYVTFRFTGPVHFRWAILAPDGLPLDPYLDGLDEVTHGKTGASGGTFELQLELPAGLSTADVELSILSEPL